MKISVCIPCAHKHMDTLRESIDSIWSNTRPPDEVNVVISGVSGPVSGFEDVNLITTHKLLKTSEARNLLASNSTGDLIVAQDADDVSSSQRIEVLEYLFLYHNVSFVNHQWVSYKSGVIEPIDDFRSLKLVTIDELMDTFFPHGNYEDCLKIPRKLNLGAGKYGRMCDGPCSYRSYVFDDVKYRLPAQSLLYKDANKHPQEFEFCMESLFKFRNSLFVLHPLYYYRYGSARNMVRSWM